MSYPCGRGAGRRAAWILGGLLLAASVPAQAGDSQNLAVSAVVLSRSVCRFQSGPATLDFGTINPASSTNATASTTMQFWCLGAFTNTTYSVQMGNGLYPLGAGLRRVRHATVATEFMQYSLSVTPASGTIPWLSTQTITFTGTITPVAYQNARAGAYSDTVVVDISP